MIGTLLMDRFFDPPLIGMVVARKSGYAVDYWQVEWYDGEVTGRSQVYSTNGLYHYIKSHQEFKNEL